MPRYAGKKRRHEVEVEAFSEEEALEVAEGNLGKAVFAFLDALSQYEETTDVDELYRQFRGSNPEITVSKALLRAWQRKTTKSHEPTDGEFG